MNISLNNSVLPRRARNILALKGKALARADRKAHADHHQKTAEKLMEAAMHYREEGDEATYKMYFDASNEESFKAVSAHETGDCAQ